MMTEILDIPCTLPLASDVTRYERKSVQKNKINVSEQTVWMLDVDQEVQHLKQALSKPSYKQRQVIENAYKGEVTYQRISDQPGLPLAAIKSRIRLGLEQLRLELKEL